MTFDEILEQIITLLKRQGRISYSAVRRRFDLDDAFLEDLKDELLFTYPVIDEGGRGLVWTDEVDETPSQSDQAEPQPTLHQNQSTQAKPPSEPLTPDAERRQLTVMFCDLADSTQLSGQLDPEDLRDVIRAYQSTSAEVIERYDGYIAQHLGDGLMVYFGWPQAHEDDAQRAVHAGLGILEAMQGLNSPFGAGKRHSPGGTHWHSYGTGGGGRDWPRGQPGTPGAGGDAEHRVANRGHCGARYRCH